MSEDTEFPHADTWVWIGCLGLAVGLLSMTQWGKLIERSSSLAARQPEPMGDVLVGVMVLGPLMCVLIGICGLIIGMSGWSLNQQLDPEPDVPEYGTGDQWEQENL